MRTFSTRSFSAERERKNELSTEELEQVFRYVEENFASACESSEVTEYSEDASLSEYIKAPEETWQEMLIRLLGEKGMTNPECYKKADVDRKLFSKIMENRNHAPRKDTAIRLALALELSLEDANKMLEKAGYALSHASRRDLAIEYFFLNRKYDLFEINYALHMMQEAQLSNNK